MCTNELVLFVVLFQARAVSSSLFERARRSCLVSSLIISDPGERRALSLHTIKATELPQRPCFSMTRGSRVHTKSSMLSPHHLSQWEAANIQGFDQAAL